MGKIIDLELDKDGVYKEKGSVREEEQPTKRKKVVGKRNSEGNTQFDELVDGFELGLDAIDRIESLARRLFK